MQESDIKCFLVKYNRDLTEGKVYHNEGVVLVHANHSHQELVEHWCYEEFGNKIAFCMGAYGSSALVTSWAIQPLHKSLLANHNILHRIKDPFLTNK